MSGNGVPPNINITNIAQAKNAGCASGCGGCLATSVAIAAVVLFIGAGWLLGSWVAVTILGANEGSTAAVTIGWIFEVVYLALLGLVGVALWKNREKMRGNQKADSEGPTPQWQLGRTTTGETAFARESTENSPPPAAQRPPSPPPFPTVPPPPEKPQEQAPAAAFCDQCGSPSRAGAKFCSACGTQL